MKKSIKSLIWSICLTPAILLTACVPPPSYTITASSSDTQLGYVKGFETQEKQEGSKITISAVSTSQSPFLAWVKDDKTIVSNEESLNLIYNSKTAGHYTAVFEETSISKMSYASLTALNFSPAGYSKIEWTVSTAILSSGSNDYYQLTNGEYSPGQEHTVEADSVLYFGGAGDEYVYLIKLNFKLFNALNEETTFEYILQTKIDKNTFNDKAGLVINENIEALKSTPISLTFQKLSSKENNEFENVSPEDDEEENETPPIETSAIST